MTWTRAGNICIIIAVLLLAYLGYEKIQNFYIEKKLMSGMSVLEVPIEDSDTPTTVSNQQVTEGVELSIPKLDLTVPVLEGTTQDILRIAIGHLAESGRLGAEGENFVLLGHRSHVTGRFFNRLDELVIGDEFSVTANGKQYSYKVIEKKVIKPTELEVIQPREGKIITTLITCHPMYSNKQRLVVVGEKI